MKKQTKQLSEKQRQEQRQWWHRLDDLWKSVFKQAISIKHEPTDHELEKIIHLSELDCWEKKSAIYNLYAL